jgi:hypothetical protein
MADTPSFEDPGSAGLTQRIVFIFSVSLGGVS